MPLFLGSGPGRGQIPVEWGDFSSVHSSVRSSPLHNPLAGPQTPLVGPQTPPDGPQNPPTVPQIPPTGQLRRSDIQIIGYVMFLENSSWVLRVP